MIAQTTRFLRIKDVLSIVPVSRPTIYRLMEKGQFPKAVAIGAARLWPEHEINNWMKDRLEERNEI